MPSNFKYKVLVWVGVWILTRALMLVQVGFWSDLGINYQDVEFYKNWSDTLAVHHQMPDEDSWQYPPGAAFLLLVPRLGSVFGAAYQPSFVVMMLAVDLVGLVVMGLLARRSGRSTGVWIWLLTVPLLQAIPLTRFDLAPTVLTMAALVFIHRRTTWFGALVGAGAALKIFPVVALFGEWDRRRLVRASATAAAVAALVFIAAAISFGDQSGFFANQDVRGLQKESVGGIPWYLQWTVTGREPEIVLSSGTAEFGGPVAEAVAVALKWLGLLVLLAAAAWWVARERAIRRGRIDLADAAVSRDLVFTIVLLQVVVSRVLSPQFMLWVIGVAAVVLGSERTNLERPAWLAIGAVLLTTGIYLAPANMAIRNLVLLAAAVDATLIMVRLLREPTAEPVAVGKQPAAVTAERS
ncbi:MAG TPA: glycosyltransferase family 87 protein [Solirubrobacterales bacterium]